jgi:hypothetical protein
VVPPPWIICLKIWPTGLLLKVVESVHLFHLRKYYHQWTILCLVHRLAQTKQLSTGNVFASLMGFPTLRASNLLTMASILWVNSDSPFNSRMPPVLRFWGDLSRQLVKSHCCELSANLSKVCRLSLPLNLKTPLHSSTLSCYGWAETTLGRRIARVAIFHNHEGGI